MNQNYMYDSLDYINGHKVYCFKRSFSNINPLNRTVYKYQEGDYLPLNSNNYIYGTDVLIVDLKNKLVHIVEDGVYKKTVRILNKLNSSIYPYFKKRSYTSIDIYGNMLNIVNIFDLYNCVNSYPSLEVYLEERNNYIKKDIFDDIKENYITVISKISQYRDNGLSLSGYVLNCSNNKAKEGYSFEVLEKLNKELLAPLIRSFEEEFYDKDNINFIANNMMELFDLLYSLSATNNGKIIKYITNGKLKVAHIDKVKREIKSIIDDNCESDLDYIMDLIFSWIYDEDYIDFIVSTISEILDIND